MRHRGSEDSSAREHEKSPFQEGETRNPTTAKKTGLSPMQFRRTEPFQLGSGSRKVSGKRYRRYGSLHMERSSLQMERERFIDAQEYSEAERVDRQIRRSQQRMQRKTTRLVQRTQEEQRRSMRVRLEREARHFEGVWDQYFEQFNKRELHRMIGFKEKQQRLLQQTRTRLSQRCRSLRCNNGELVVLEQRKRYFQRRGDLQELRLIKQERRNAVAKVAKERQQMIAVWTQLQEQNFSRLQLNKYQNFVRKLEQARCDLTRYYQQEKSRLQQRHVNALSSLEHILKMGFRQSHLKNFSQ